MINSLISRFAADTGPVIHIEPGGVFHLGGYTITNSIFYAWIVSAIMIVGLSIIAHRATIKPKRGITQVIEIGTEFIMSLVENSLGSRKKALKYGPYFVTIFFFVLFSNWFGLLPGVGEAIRVGETPLFRPFTADLNGTLSIAIISMIFIQAFAIRESGILKHIRHYFNGSLKNPVTYLFGGLEVFTEFTRVISLALRLFLNVVIGEIIITVFGFLGKAAAPITTLPFVMLEMFVGALQAYIFVTLSVTYLAVAIQHEHEYEAEDNEPEANRPDHVVPDVSGTKQAPKPRVGLS